MIDNLAGQEPGDPAKAARAILRALDSEDPPLRLALGDEAVENIRANHPAASR